MNFLKLSSIAFAALVSVSAASAQIITNYGQTIYPGSAWSGNWQGAGEDTQPGRWYAQTFIPPASSTSNSQQIFAYNVQFNIQNGATPSFTTAIYEWDASTLTLVGNALEHTTANFTFSTDSGFNIYGANVITNPGIGTAFLDPAKTYAIVVQRVDDTPGGVAQIGSATHTFFSSGTPYTDGGVYGSWSGSTFGSLGADTDLAFWVSFSESSLSPVPEPAVSGTLIGAGFVGALLLRRRRKQKADAVVPVA